MRWTHGLGSWSGPMCWADGLRLLEVNINSVPSKSCLCLRSAQYLTCDVCFLCKVLHWDTCHDLYPSDVVSL